MIATPPTVRLRAVALRRTPPPQAGEENRPEHLFSSPVYGGGVEPGVSPGRQWGRR